MRIFVAVGFENYPFDRLVSAVEAVFSEPGAEAEVFIQTGVSGRRPRTFAWRDFLEFDEIAARLRDAEVVICHAGVGTTLLALSLGKSPILFPRRAQFGEHVDDHQTDFALRMEKAGKVRVAWDEEGLRDAVREAGRPVARSATGNGAGPARLREFLAGLMENGGRKGRARP